MQENVTDVWTMEVTVDAWTGEEDVTMRRRRQHREPPVVTDTSSGPDPPGVPAPTREACGCGPMGRGCSAPLHVIDETCRAEPPRGQPELWHVVLSTPSQPHRFGALGFPWKACGLLPRPDICRVRNPPARPFACRLGISAQRRGGQGFPTSQPRGAERAPEPRLQVPRPPGRVSSQLPSPPPGACLAGPGWTGGWVGR